MRHNGLLTVAVFLETSVQVWLMTIDIKALGNFTEDPQVSWTLPGFYYYEPEIYAQELETIFYRTWQYVCHVSRLRKPGQYLVRDIGEQSIIVLKDQAGEIRAFHNVCQHRAHRLLEGEGQLGKTITCPYHAWCYGLAGELVAARGSRQMPDFPKDEIRLAPIKVDQICGFVFVNLDAAAKPMAEIFVGLEQELLLLAPDAEKLCRAHTQDFPLKANWKNSVENYSECYHCPNRHPSLTNQALDIKQYRINVHAGYHRHVTSDVGEHQGYALKGAGGENGHEFGSWFLFPNMVFEVYPGGNLTVFNHVPVGPEATLQETEWYFPGDVPTADEQEVIDFVNIVREEDIPICESVQRGLHSKGYSQGKFIVDDERTYLSEHAVHDFQLRVARALCA
ncbi:MAG: aromatic ring-hydroxylating dioxygenase subunit alpha [SAR324 cluster bacterium]|nr:aromatic ring-hydroxylating dioxygenase subunit alpha [SAR324 cluster bacterium]